MRVIIGMKPDGVDPVDNKPSIDKLHYFCPEKNLPKKKWHTACDMLPATCDTCWGWPFTKNFSSVALMWHVTHGGGEQNLKMSGL